MYKLHKSIVIFLGDVKSNETWKKSSRLFNTVFILLDVQNNPHGCLYIVAFVFNIFENFWGTLL